MVKARRVAGTGRDQAGDRSTRARRSPSPSAPPAGDSPLPRSKLSSSAAMERVRPFLVANKEDPAFRKTRPGNSTPKPKTGTGEIVNFYPFVLAGLIPPFSNFFMSFLGCYGLRMAHLPANAVLTLAIFSHLCEAFVGVQPCISVFRRYFRMTSTDRKVTAGGVRLTIMPGSDYIGHFPAHKAEGWKELWFYMDYGRVSERLQLPIAPAQKVPAFWDALPATDDRLAAIHDRIAALAAAGLNSTHVIADFLKTNIAPLHRRSRPSWLYLDFNFEGRTRVGPNSDLSAEDVAQAYKFLTGLTLPEDFSYPKEAQPLRLLANKTQLISALPVVNAEGLERMPQSQPRVASTIHIPGEGQQQQQRQQQQRQAAPSTDRGKRVRDPSPDSSDSDAPAVHLPPPMVSSTSQVDPGVLPSNPGPNIVPGATQAPADTTPATAPSSLPNPGATPRVRRSPGTTPGARTSSSVDPSSTRSAAPSPGATPAVPPFTSAAPGARSRGPTPLFRPGWKRRNE